MHPTQLQLFSPTYSSSKAILHCSRMKAIILTIGYVLCAIRYHEATQVSSDFCNGTASGSEIIGKLEDLDHKFLNSHKEIMIMLNRLVQAVGHNFTTKMDHSSEILQQQTSVKTINSCAEVPSCKSGKYTIHPLNFEEPIEVYCEQNVFDGGWIVVQYRFDGSVDFYRNWTEYRNGFGSLDGEFWFGLENLHRLTKGGDHQLLVELKEFNGNNVFARYYEFEIGNENEAYALKTLGKYSGTAGDALSSSKYMKFTTKDKDKDYKFLENCAIKRSGAWWYYYCSDCNLNGLYKKGIHKDSMHWYTINSNYDGLAFSRMMIRKIATRGSLNKCGSEKP
nr:microfibril-associated glycoprotein 4-like [Aedes albopictus]